MTGVIAALLLALAFAGAAVTVQASPAAAQAGPVGPGVGCPPEASGGPNEATNGALLDKIVPGQSAEERPGCFPTSAYRVDFHQGNILDAPDNMMGWFTDFLFGLTRVLVAIGLWIVEWVFTFGFAARLAQPAADIAARYQSNFATPVVVRFVLTLAAVYGGFHMLRGRLGRGLGEFGLSVFIVSFFAAFIISQPKTFLDNSLKTTGALSGSVVSLAVNCGAECESVQLGRCPAGATNPACTVPAGSVAGSRDPATNPSAAGPPAPGSDRAEYVFDQYRGLIRPLERGIHQAFIEQPYQLLQWGQAVPAGECTNRMNRILAQSPGGDRNRIIHIMKNGEMGKEDGGLLGRLNPVRSLAELFDGDEGFDGQCDALYKFNRQPSMERVGMAALALFAATIIIILLVLVAGTVVAAQLVAVALIALTPLAALGGALPGAGRQALWRWVASFARALLAILLMSAFLAFLLVTSKAVFDTTADEALLVRMAGLNLVTIVAFVARKKMLAAGHRVATNFGRRLEGASIGGNRASWMAPAAVGGATGFALARQLSEMTGEGQQVTGPLGRAVTRRFHNRERARALTKAMGAAGMGAGEVSNYYAGHGSADSHTTFNALHIHMPGGSGRGHHDDVDDDIVDGEVVEDVVEDDEPRELVAAGATR